MSLQSIIGGLWLPPRLDEAGLTAMQRGPTMAGS
jgi:hypothetical protein